MLKKNPILPTKFFPPFSTISSPKPKDLTLLPKGRPKTSAANSHYQLCYMDSGVVCQVSGTNMYLEVGLVTYKILRHKDTNSKCVIFRFKYLDTSYY